MKSVMRTEPWKGTQRSRSGSRYPALSITWEEAKEFCRRLSVKEGRSYDLPSEAQWEYACRAGSSGAFSFGNGSARSNTLARYGWYRDNSGVGSNRFIHQVRDKRPNKFGLYDMHGNAWEWCSDWYSDTYYAMSPSEDPKGPTFGVRRCRRGGSFIGSANSCASYARSSWGPTSRIYDQGFRLMLSLDAPSAQAIAAPNAGAPKAAANNAPVNVATVQPKAPAAPKVAPLDALVAKSSVFLGMFRQTTPPPSTHNIRLTIERKQGECDYLGNLRFVQRNTATGSDTEDFTYDIRVYSPSKNENVILHCTGLRANPLNAHLYSNTFTIHAKATNIEIVGNDVQLRPQ